MTYALLLLGGILFISVIASKLLYKYGIPTLLIFLTLGILLGSEGLGGIYFDDSILTQQIATIGLVLIMFYGGFGFNWKMARPVALQSILLSTIGVAVTALLIGTFAFLILDISFIEGMLLGSIVSSTDAASVFSILRSKKLNLKDGLASMVEMESGSNDPMAYILTITMITLLTGRMEQSVFSLLLMQILFGLTVGFLTAAASVFILKKIYFEIDGLYPILIISAVLIGFSFSERIGGNGLLAVYIIGVVTGNSKIPQKKSMVHFFDGISWLMQIILFFTLGLLVFPSQLVSVWTSGLIIALFMIFIARPLAVVSILSWFKIPFRHQMLVSWVGLRGAASIVFATYALANNLDIANDVFNTVFFISLFSIIVQGTTIPLLAKKLNLVEEESSIYRTFTDYKEEVHNKLVDIYIDEDNSWAGKHIMEADIPEGVVIVMLKRGEDIIMPKGSTKILKGDTLIIAANDLNDLEKI